MPDPIVVPPAAVLPQAPAPAKPPVPAAQVPPASAAVPPVTPPPAAKPAGVPPAPAQEGMVPITALHEEREKRQQMQAQLDAMKKVMSNNVLFDMNGNPVMQQQQVQPQQNYQQEMDKLWESDPRKAVQAEIYQAMAWRDKVDSDVEGQANEVANKYVDFNTVRSEVMNYVRTLPLEGRGRPGIIEAAYYFIRGQKVDNIIAQKQREMESEYMRKFQAGELASMLPPGTGSLPPVQQGAVVLTQEQKNAAAAMRVPEAEYAKWITGKV